MMKNINILCVFLFLLLASGAAIPCMADDSYSTAIGSSLKWRGWKDVSVQDYCKGAAGLQKQGSEKSGGATSALQLNSSMKSAYSYGSGNSVSAANALWYRGGTAVDLSSILSLVSNWNLFAGVYEIDDDGQIFGSVNIGGVLYNFVLNPVNQVPIPGSLLLLVSSAGLLGLMRRRIG
jgi:hypothetical protein